MGHGDAIEYVVEFGALAVIGVLMLAFWQKASAQRYQGEAALAGPNAWANLEMNAGDALIGSFSAWSNRIPAGRSFVNGGQ